MSEYNNYGRVDTQAHNLHIHGNVYHGHHETPNPSTNPSDFKHGLNLVGAPEIEERLFIGRNSELHRMKASLCPGEPSIRRKLFILGGLGGVGKTQLAITYAKEYQEFYSSIFWLNAASEKSLNTSLRLVSETVFPLESANNWNEDKNKSRISKWFSEQQNNQWLLIFDNYDTPEEFDITKYYPHTSQGSIIITTRLPDSVTGDSLKLKSLSNEEESLKILETRSGRQNLSKDLGARKLANRLDGFPLALATAGSFLKNTKSVTFEEYLNRYEEKWNISPQRPAKLQEYHWTLYTAWDISFNRLKEDHPDAAKLLSLLGYFDNKDIWYELIKAGASSWDRKLHPSWFLALGNDHIEFSIAMSTLASYCFVESHSETYSVHSCVHDWISEGLNKDVIFSHCYIALDCISETARKHKEKKLIGLKYARLVPHCMRLLNRNFQPVWTDQHVVPKSVLANIRKVGILLRCQRQCDAAEVMTQNALTNSERLYGTDHGATLDITHELATLYSEQKQFDKAEQNFKLLMSKLENDTHERNAHSREVQIMMLSIDHGLGRIYLAQRRLDEAETALERALEGQAVHLGSDHPSTLTTVHSLGLLYQYKRNFPEAEIMYQRALDGLIKVYGIYNVDTLRAMSGLASLCSRQKKLDQSEELYREALEARKQLLGSNHRHTILTARGLNKLYKSQGREDEAEKLSQEFNLDIPSIHKLSELSIN